MQTDLPDKFLTSCNKICSISSCFWKELNAPYSVNCVDLLFRPVCYSSYEIFYRQLQLLQSFDLFRIFSLEHRTRHVDMDNVGSADSQKHRICYMYLLLWLQKPAHFAHVVRRRMGGSVILRISSSYLRSVRL